MMEKTNLHLSDEEISEYVDSLLANNINHIDKRIITHLSECELCRQKVFRLTDMIGAYEAVQKQSKRKRIFWMEILTAAAILLFAGLWFSIPVLHNDGKLLQDADKAQSLKYFAENDFYEELCGQKLRDDKFQLISPLIDTTITSDVIHFKWQAKTKGLTLTILDNSGKNLFSMHAVKNAVDVPNHFRPGLYYWKLETEDNLIFVGKFKIKI